VTTTPTTTTPEPSAAPAGSNDLALAMVLNHAINFETAKTRHELDGQPASGAAARRAEDDLRSAVRTYMERVGL
jgi:hypothetical protein